jgi:excisionase family DNA binding protein
MPAKPTSVHSIASGLERSLERNPIPGATPRIQPRAYSIEEAAQYIGATVWFLRTLVWNRRIPYLKHGHRYAFDRADLDRFLEANKVGVQR